ncbi:MAG TPA: hypothetical protein VFF28_07990 [Candidatus Nanoarchaeia archaeon]|nr:hypothetical protein [Candidatus Nanoarchaeia archaeon]
MFQCRPGYAGQMQVEYLYKKGSGETLLFLHGFGVHPAFYERLLDKLAGRYEIIAPIAYGMNCLGHQPTNIGSMQN